MRLLTLVVLAFVAACADLPTSIETARPKILLLFGNPPPPPADGGIFFPPPPPPSPPPPPAPLQLGTVGVRYFLNPPGTTAWVTFVALDPSVRISPNARVRQQLGGGLVGIGTIRAGGVVVDLSTAQGSLFPVGGERFFSFITDAQYENSGLPVPAGVLFAYTF